MEENKSPMELAMEYITAHPELTDVLDDNAFQTFFEHPERCIAKYEAVLEVMRVRFQFTDEMIAEHCKDYLADSCEHVANLIAKES